MKKALILACAAALVPAAAQAGMYPDSTSFSANNHLAPACTASAPANGSVGTPLTVSASCSPAASSYAWTATNGTTPSGASSNITPAAAGTYTYTVTGTNANGAGLSSAPVTVNVVASTPVCTISFSSILGNGGSPYAVTATCSGSPTNYDWSASTAPTKPAAGAASGNVSLPGPATYAFTVRAYNANGWGSPATNTLCVGAYTTQIVSCPVGYTGNVVQRQDYSCATASWGAWYNVANSCTPYTPPACTATSETQTVSCAAGYTGSITQQRNYTCPAASWSSWYTTSTTCAPICTQRSETQSVACSAGYTGSITQQRDYTCPAASWGAWTTTNNGCVAQVHLYRVGKTTCTSGKNATCTYTEYFVTSTSAPASPGGSVGSRLIYAAVNDLGVFGGSAIPRAGSCGGSDTVMPPGNCIAPGLAGWSLPYPYKVPYGQPNGASQGVSGWWEQIDPQSNIYLCQQGIECAGGT